MLGKLLNSQRLRPDRPTLYPVMPESDDSAHEYYPATNYLETSDPPHDWMTGVKAGELFFLPLGFSYTPLIGTRKNLWESLRKLVEIPDVVYDSFLYECPWMGNKFYSAYPFAVLTSNEDMAFRMEFSAMARDMCTSPTWVNPSLELREGIFHWLTDDRGILIPLLVRAFMGHGLLQPDGHTDWYQIDVAAMPLSDGSKVLFYCWEYKGPLPLRRK